MTSLTPVLPAQLQEMTLPQLYCMLCEEPPDSTKITSADEYMRLIEREQAEARRWQGEDD